MDQERPHLRDHGSTVMYHSYTLVNRKTEVGSDRVYNLHAKRPDDMICTKSAFDDWYKYATMDLKHCFTSDVLFPALKIGKDLTKDDAIKWTQVMEEGKVTVLLNRVVEAMLADAEYMVRPFCSKMARCFENVHWMTHTFRRGMAQYKFINAPPAKRWGLKMVKWWGGWSEKDGTDVIMKYLLDSVYSVEEEILADANAPDRDHLAGCPTTWLLATHSAPKDIKIQEQARSSSRLDAIETTLKELSSTITILTKSLCNFMEGHSKLPTVSVICS